MKGYNDVSWDSDMTNNSLIVLNTATVYIGNMCILFTWSMESMFYDNARVVVFCFKIFPKLNMEIAKTDMNFLKWNGIDFIFFLCVFFIFFLSSEDWQLSSSCFDIYPRCLLLFCTFSYLLYYFCSNSMLLRVSYLLYYFEPRGHCGHDRMVVGFTYAIGAYHQYSCGFESCLGEVYSI